MPNRKPLLAWLRRPIIFEQGAVVINLTISPDLSGSEINGVRVVTEVGKQKDEAT